MKPTVYLLGVGLLSGTLASGQTVAPKLDSEQTPGQRPYEMVWANRVEPASPTLRFDQLDGWTAQVEGGAQATLQVTRAQNVWDRPVARLRYRGEGKADAKPRVVLRPPQPVQLPGTSDSVEMWVYGNRWGWVNPPGTPPVRILLHLRDNEDQALDVTMDSVRWEEWWLVHRRLPKTLPPSARLESIEIAGGWQPDWREIFFDSIRFYSETVAPLHFTPRAQRNLTLFDGQSAGVNTGTATSCPFRRESRRFCPCT